MAIPDLSNYQFEVLFSSSSIQRCCACAVCWLLSLHPCFPTLGGMRLGHFKKQGKLTDSGVF